MTAIDHLNLILGDRLGRLPDGRPRFTWNKAHDARYFVNVRGRVRVTDWSKRIGDVWVLCGWSEPVMFDPATNSQKPIERAAWAKFSGGVPYPTGGMWRAYPETAVPLGHLPTDKLTANYAWAIDRQMSQDFFGHLNAIDVDLALDAERRDNEWVEQVQASAPAFQNFAPGKRGGQVSYGGL